jgi:hypothetical protein
MSSTTTDTFTVAVFKDVEWATRGLDALARQGFPPEALSIIVRETPDASTLLARAGSGAVTLIDVHGLGRCHASGPLVGVLEGSDQELSGKGLAASFRRAGFQAHDGRIFETLTARGGVLVAVRTEPRAADALATLHAYGGGNAAIGAWHGRV